MDAKKDEILQSITNEKRVTTHYIALARLLNRGSNVLLIPGTSNIQHLEGDTQVGSIELSDKM